MALQKGSILEANRAAPPSIAGSQMSNHGTISTLVDVCPRHFGSIAWGRNVTALSVQADEVVKCGESLLSRWLWHRDYRNREGVHAYPHIVARAIDGCCGENIHRRGSQVFSMSFRVISVAGDGFGYVIIVGVGGR